MDKHGGPSGQRGPLMVTSPDGDPPESGTPSTAGTTLSSSTGKGFFGSIAKKRFTKALNMVKFAMKFDNTTQDESKSALSQKPEVKIQMENSYRLEPEDKDRFSVRQTENLIRDVLEDHLCKYQYSKVTGPRIVQTLCTVIKDKVKKLGFPRYKIIVNVFIGALGDQALEATSRCLWDAKKDTFACANYRGKGFFAVGMVHAVYFE